MQSRLFGWALAVAALPSIVGASFAACSNNVVVPGSTGGSGGSGGDFPTGSSSSTGGKKDAGKDAFPDYTEPTCPSKPPPIQDYQCDPYHQGNGDCQSSEGCYIFVDYPSDPCGQETYGSLCMPAGAGQQGDPCQGAQSCGPGLVCVVTGSGTQCVELCSLTGPSGCPSGLVCEPIDVEGFGGCL
jgi:hypothetical protein